MEKWPKISIVTPSYNQGQFLEKTIIAVLNQKYSNLEYIILDGGSTDGSVEIIKGYESYLKYWRSEPDDGHSAAYKEGFKMATGDILCWINSDDILLSGALQIVASVFSKNPRIQCFTGNCIYIDSEDNYLFTHYSPTQTYKHMLRNTMLNCQPATFWRKSIYTEVGGIDTRFEYCVDYDLFLRMVKEARRMYSVPVPLAAFRIHEKSKGSRLHEINRKEWKLIRSAYGVEPTYLGKMLWRVRMKNFRTRRRIKNFFFNRRDRKILDETLFQIYSKSGRND